MTNSSTGKQNGCVAKSLLPWQRRDTGRCTRSHAQGLHKAHVHAYPVFKVPGSKGIISAKSIWVMYTCALATCGPHKVPAQQSRYILVHVYMLARFLQRQTQQGMSSARRRGPHTDNIAQHSAVHDGIIDVVPAALRLPVYPIGQAHL